MLLFDTSTDDPAFAVIGSNVSKVAEFGSTLDNAYVTFYANDPNSNVGYVVGTSNQTQTNPVFSIGMINTTNNSIYPDFTISNHFTGINNTNPAYTLDVGGNINLSGTIYNSGGVARAMWTSNVRDAYYTVGNVGIGLTNPTSRLHVQGNTYITGSVYASNLVNSAYIDTTNATNITTGTLTSSIFPLTGVSAAIYGSKYSIPVITIDQYGRISYASNIGLALSATTDTTNASNITTGVLPLSQMPTTNIDSPPATYGAADTVPQITTDIYGRVNHVTNKFIAITAAQISGLAPVATLGAYSNLISTPYYYDSLNTTYYNGTGNVGIGTTLASLAKLQVQGDIYASGRIITSNITVIGEFTTVNTTINATEQFVVTNAGLGPALKVSQTTVQTVAEYYQSTGALALQIAANGNVGIGGVTNATKTLYVQGDVGISGSIAAANLAASAFTDTTNATNITTGTLPVAQLATSGVTAGTYGNAYSLPIISVDTKGRVTYAANSNIQVSPSQVTGLAAVATSGNYNDLANRTFVLNGAAAFYSAGNVGIGTNAPDATLSIGGGSTDTASALKINVGDAAAAAVTDRILLTATGASNSRISHASGGSVTHFAGQSNNTGTFHIMTGTAGGTIYQERLTVHTNGFVGINNAAPANALDVIGNVNCSATLYNAANPIASAGKIVAAALPTTTVAAGTYGIAASVATFTVDVAGRLTNAVNTPIQILPAQVTGLAPSATTDTTNATNITSGTLSSNQLQISGVTAGSYGTAASNAVYVVDTKGRITLTSNLAIQILPAQVTGLAASATINTTNATNITSGTLNANQLPVSGVATGTYGTATNVPTISVDITGRVTSAVNTPIQILPAQVTGLATSATTDTTNATNITSGTLSSNQLQISGVTAGYYGSAAAHPVYTVDTKGRITLTSNVSIQILPAQVTGLAPSATTDTTNATNITSGTLSSNQLQISGVTAGSYGTATNVPTVSIDTKGRITTAANMPIQILPAQVTGLAPSATTDTTNATNITSGTLSSNQLQISGVTAGTYGSASTSASIVIDSKGRVTAATAPAIAIAAGAVSGLATVATSGNFADLANTPFTFSAAGTSYYNGTGSVGIGTHTALSALHVVGDILSTGRLIASNISILGELTTLNLTTSNTERLFVYNAGIGPALTVSQVTSDIVSEFYNNTGIVMQMGANGNVGIGTRNAAKTLFVQGDIGASGNISAANLAASAFIDTTNATNITSGTLSSNQLQASGVVAGTYGSASTSASIVIDSKGRVTAATAPAIAIPTGQVTGLSTIAVAANDSASYASGSYGIVASGKIPVITFDSYGRAVAAASTAISITTSQISDYVDPHNAANITTGTLALGRLPTTNVLQTAGTAFGGVATVPSITTDVYGRVTNITTSAIAIASTAVSGLAPSATLDTTVASNITSGTLPLARLPTTNVAQASGTPYGNATTVPTITTDAYGRVINITNTTIALTPTNLPNSTVAAAIYGSPSSIPQFTVDQYGRITNAVNCNVNIPIFTGQYSNLSNVPFTFDSLGSSIYTNQAVVNVGISTTAPAYPLDVNGTLRATRFIGDGSLLTGVLTGSGGGFASQWTSLGCNIYLQNSNVGIGTMTPQAALHVQGNTLCTGMLTTSNITILNSTFIASDTQVYRSALQINPVRQFFTVSTTTQSIFQLTASTTGRYTAYASNTEIYQNGIKLGYSSALINDYTVATVYNANTTTFNVTLNTAAMQGDYIDIVVWPSLVDTGLALQPGYVYQQFYDLWSVSNNNVFYSAGNVGIGTNVPAYSLHVAGNIYCTNSIVAYSDQAIKTNVATLKNALDTVTRLRGVSYTRRDTGENQIGVIAQEVKAVLPEVVSQSSEGLAVAYGNMTGLLIEAVKELHEEVQYLRGLVLTAQQAPM